MKKLTKITEDFEIPGTEVTLEEGDRVLVEGRDELAYLTEELLASSEVNQARMELGAEGAGNVVGEALYRSANKLFPNDSAKILRGIVLGANV